MTQDEFDRLLAWLDHDRERAATRYEEIRQSLIKIFTWRGCADAEGLADEVINRVATRLPEFVEEYVGDPAPYFYGVTKNLLHEYHRRMKARAPLDDKVSASVPVPEPEGEDSERLHECLSRCVGGLDADSRELITAYYSLDRHDKIGGRKALARRNNISVNNLRVKVHRIRAVLEKCIKECLKQGLA